jgi:hypothetical protein
VLNSHQDAAQWVIYEHIKPWFERLEYVGDVVVEDRRSRELVRCSIYRGHSYRAVPNLVENPYPGGMIFGEEWKYAI